jgi:hypothetical protein
MSLAQSSVFLIQSTNAQKTPCLAICEQSYTKGDPLFLCVTHNNQISTKGIRHRFMQCLEML